MGKCTLHNLLTSCQYPQVFWIYMCDEYDKNILLAKGTKIEMCKDEDDCYELLEHINDEVDYWTIREDGAMFVRLKMEGKVEDMYCDAYIKKWDRCNPNTRPWLYSCEMDDFTHVIHGSSSLMHHFADPLGVNNE